MSNTERFIETYKKMEHIATNYYNDCKEYEGGKSVIRDLMNDNRFDSERVLYCSKCRNILSHNRKFEDGFSIMPTNGMIRFLKDVIMVLDQKISDIWVAESKMVRKPKRY